MGTSGSSSFWGETWPAITTVLNPAAQSTVLFQTAGNYFEGTFFGDWMMELSKADIFYQASTQATQNLFNVIDGKETFGNHDNWFGHGTGADFLNSLWGSKTDAQRESENQNNAQYGMWSYYEKNNRFSPTTTESGESTGLLGTWNSLLS